jgi:pimeloyl-ACP methyl ester carboxylesterase
MPRTVGRIAAELHELLSAAEVPPPYVLVGHSFGGLSIRAYASRHPDDVAGLVFVDPAHPEDWREPSAADRERLQRGVVLCRRGVFAARLGIASLVARLASAGALDLARGIAAAVSRRTLQRQDEEILAPVTRFPMDVRATLRWMWTQPRYFEALGSQIEHICRSASETDLQPDYGTRPVVTISATGVSPPQRVRQDALARRSSRGRHVTAVASGHWIPIDEPQIVVESIRQVVMAVRAGDGTP